MVCPRIAEEVRTKQDARANLTPRRIEVAKKGAEQFLRRFRRETGGLPTRSTWRNAWQGELDAGGRQIVVRLKCHLCGMERILGLGDADAIPTAFQARGFSCGLLQDVKCGETAPGQRGEPLELRQARGLSASEERPSLGWCEERRARRTNTRRRYRDNGVLNRCQTILQGERAATADASVQR